MRSSVLRLVIWDEYNLRERTTKNCIKYQWNIIDNKYSCFLLHDYLEVEASHETHTLLVPGSDPVAGPQYVNSPEKKNKVLSLQDRIFALMWHELIQLIQVKVISFITIRRIAEVSREIFVLFWPYSCMGKREGHLNIRIRIAHSDLQWVGNHIFKRDLDIFRLKLFTQCEVLSAQYFFFVSGCKSLMLPNSSIDNFKDYTK